MVGKHLGNEYKTQKRTVGESGHIPSNSYWDRRGDPATEKEWPLW